MTSLINPLSLKTSQQRLPDLAIYLLLGLAGSVLAGWWLNISLLTQWRPDYVPMQFNTALCFVIAGLAILSLKHGRPGVTKALVTAMFLLTLLTLLQYPLDIDAGIDQLFIHHDVVVGTSHPGRMAPNTAIVFLLFSLVLLTPDRSRGKGYLLMLRGVLIASILTLSSLALLGYMAGFEAGYGWGAWTQMAVHTALAFLIGGAVLAQDCLSYMRAPMRRKIVSFQLFLCFFALTLTLWLVLKQQERHHAARYTEVQASRQISEFQLQWTELQNALTRMQQRWEQAQPDLQNKDNTRLSQARALIDDRQALVAIAEYSHGKLKWRALQRESMPRYLGDSIPAVLQPLQVFHNNQEKDKTTIVVQMRRMQGSASGIIASVIDLHAIIVPLVDELMLSEVQAEVRYQNKYVYRNGPAFEDGQHYSLSSAVPGLTIALHSSREHSPFTDWILVIGTLLSMLLSSLLFLLQKSSHQSKKLEIERDQKETSLAALNTSRNLANIAAEVSGLGVWTWDPNNDDVDMDAQLLRIIGTEPAMHTGQQKLQGWLDYLHPGDIQRVTEGLQQLCERKGSWHDEFRLCLNNGKVRYLKSYAKWTADQSPRGKIIGGCLDITADQKMWQHLQQLTEKAEEANQAKTDFLANMSHELRTPMNGIIGIGELMSRTQLSSKQREYLTVVRQSAKSLLGILNDILDLSKVEAGAMRLQEDDMHIEEWLVSVIQSLGPTAEGKGIDLEYFLDPAMPAIVHADSLKLSQILMNLVGNAVKFTHHGRVQVDVMCESHKENHDTCELTLRVSDTGIGVARSMHASIFSPFTQANSSTSRDYGGTGLGLSIVKSLVTLMNGTLSFESAPGKGTKVTVTLPLKVADNPVERTNRGPLNGLQTTLSKQALILSENSSSCRWLRAKIESWGCAVTVLRPADIPTKQRIYSTNVWDIVFLDHELITHHSDEVTVLVPEFKLNSTTLVVMVPTGLSDQEERKLKCWSDSHMMSHFLLKPLSESEVYHLLIGETIESESDITTDKVSQPVRVLVAEDNLTNQLVVNEVLTQRGHLVTLVSDGHQVLSEYQRGEHDLILMDVQMPHLDGLDATREIRRREASEHKAEQIPIIGLTAKALRGDREECLAAGMDEYMSKPVDADALTTLVEKLALGGPERERLSMSGPAVTELVSASPESGYLDYERCMATTGGSLTLLQKVISLAVRQLQQQIPELEQDLIAGRYDAMGKGVHRLKGTVSGFCTRVLTDECQTLEGSLKSLSETTSNDWSRLKAKLEIFIKALNRAADKNNQKIMKGIK